MNRSQALLLVLGLLASAARADIHPNTAPGFQPDQSFHVGDVDNVNLFNGALTLTVALGGTYPVNGGFSYGVKLTYNANDWEWEDSEYVDPQDPNHIIKTSTAFPGSCNNAGLGWRISFGRLDPPCQPVINPYVAYQDENGTNHIFFETLHAGDPEDAPVSGVSRTLYTRDGSYLRLKIFTDGTREVESPDGTIRRFNGAGLPEHIRDRFGNKLNFFYETEAGTGKPVWRLTDSQGRTHRIIFRNDFLPLWGEVVDRVELAAFGTGLPAIYQFTYEFPSIGLPCATPGAPGQNDPPGATWPILFLTSVTLPDGSAWSMPLSDYVTAPYTPNRPCTEFAANLTGLTLPTRGRLEWAWQYYSFHQSSSDKPRLQHSAGVATRTMRDIGGAALGTWSYVSAPAGFGISSREHTTTVIDPLGHRTVNYFSMAGDGSYTGWSKFDYSLPFTRNQTLNVAPGVDLNLSRQIYNAAGALLRSEYVLYERDPAQTALFPADNTNRRVLRSRTLFHDDPAAPFSGVINSEFDGVGHYRRQQAEGSFPAGVNNRGRFDNFNPARGTYAVDQAANTGSGFTLVPPSAAWVLETKTFSRELENGAYALTENCYAANTNTLVRQRIHRLDSPTPASQSAQDLVAVYDLDVRGNVSFEKYYGGDAQAGIPTGVSDPCTMALPPAPEYQINHTYASGVRATSQYAGTGVVFLNNQNIDANTGLVATSRDLSDIGIGFEYDAMGRLTWIKPDAGHGGWTQYAYTPAAGSTGANVTIRRRDNGSKTAAILNASQIAFDGFGRVTQETRNLPGGTFNKRETLYDAAGNKASVSEWVTGAPTQKTVFSGYDPFGRPATVTPPDGVAHNVTMSYAGVRQVNRTVKIATASGLAPATTTEIYDRFGRLLQVTEPSGSADANVTTTYSYDVGNRLISVTMPSQSRSFVYDRAGFLQAETHPELGVSGNGTTSYTRYDSRGHVLRKVDGNNNLTYVYDPAERLFQVKETNGAQRLLKTFSYANASGNYTDPLSGAVCFDYRKNKITQQSRFNYVTVVGSPYTVELREGMTYCGRAGRLSRRSLDNYVNGAATPSESFVLPGVAYDALGNVTTLGYPQCTHAACTAPAPRTVTFSYTEDLLSAVGILGNAGYYATSITYHPNLMVNQVVHNNNPADSTKRLTDTYANDPNAMRRPASITVTTPTGVARWSTGTYAYDGAGNVSAIGTHTFNYDKVSRLKTANLYLEPTSSVTLRTQTYTYDAFGNILTVGVDIAETLAK